MSFILYISYIVLIYLRPIETYFPEMYEFRPVLIFSVITIIASLLGLSAQKSPVINMRHLGLIAALVFIVPFSRVMNGWPGGAPEAFSMFSASAATFLLTVMNVNTLSKLRTTLRCWRGSKPTVLPPRRLPRRRPSSLRIRHLR